MTFRAPSRQKLRELKFCSERSKSILMDPAVPQEGQEEAWERGENPPRYLQGISGSLESSKVFRVRFLTSL